MKHLSTEELRTVESIKIPMTMEDRRKRAIEVMENLGWVDVLGGYEYSPVPSKMTCGVFAALRNDPVLSAAGLKGETAGHMKKFFGWTDEDIHRMFCYCHYHLVTRVEGRSVAYAMRIYS